MATYATPDSQSGESIKREERSREEEDGSDCVATIRKHSKFDDTWRQPNRETLPPNIRTVGEPQNTSFPSPNFLKTLAEQPFIRDIILFVLHPLQSYPKLWHKRLVQFFPYPAVSQEDIKTFATTIYVIVLGSSVGETPQSLTLAPLQWCLFTLRKDDRDIGLSNR